VTAPAIGFPLPRVETVTSRYPTVIAIVGGLILALQVAIMPPPVAMWSRILVLAAVVTVLRRFVVPLSGSLLFGPVPVTIALAAGALAGDWGWQRKSWKAAAINAGREVLGLTAAFGLYASALRYLGLAGHELGLEMVPAVSFFVLSYFVIARLLFYFSLVLRAKLTHDEMSLVLRYEVVGYFVCVLATITALIAVDTLEPISWWFVAAMLVLAGLMAKRLLEEAIAAEERTKVLSVDMAVTADLALGDALERIGRLANRLVEWSDFRVYRRTAAGVELVYRNAGAITKGREPPADLEVLFEKEPGQEPEPYERLLGDAIDGIHTLFTRQDAIEETWRVVQPLLDDPGPVLPYAPGTWGPDAAKDLTRGIAQWSAPWLPDS